MPDPAYQRGLVLYQQGRYADAADRFRETLAIEPGSADAHAMLSLCLTQAKSFELATSEARFAIAADPDHALGFFALAASALERNRDDEAREAIERAIAIDRLNPSHHALLGQLYLRKSLWRMALHAADDGLASDPRHSVCLNVRATALTQLGERDAAAETIVAALADDPEDAWLHANQGWALLHRGKPRDAMTHFREALRLDPDNEWAKAGVVESLKASFFLYRWLLRYFLWMSRLSPRVRNGVMIGGFVGYQVLKGVANAQPVLRPFITPVLLAYTAFALMTWLAAALLNLLLRLHPLGKHALSWSQRRTSEIVAALLLTTVAFVIVAFRADDPGPWVTLAVATFLTTFAMVYVAKRMTERPNRVQTAVETLYALMRDNITGTNMDKGMAKKWFPFIGALFLFIWFSNMIGYIPLPTSHEKFNVFGAHIPAFSLYAATANISVPLVLTLIVWVAYHVEGVRAKGPIGYLKSWVPKGVEGPAAIPIFGIEVISHFVRIISLSVRLFANILAGHLLILFMAGGLVVLLGLAALGPLTLIMAFAFFLFEVGLVATLQAFIFATLTSIYLGGAVADDH